MTFVIVSIIGQSVKEAGERGGGRWDVTHSRLETSNHVERK